MKCPKCEYVTFDDLDRCKRCGANWVSERARFGVKDLSAPAERGPEGSPGTAILEHRLDEEFDRLYVRLKDEELKAKEVPWAGFFRRSCAFYIDVAILYALSSFLFYLTYVAYTVGLAAHGQVLDLDHLGYFLRILDRKSVV